MRKHARGPITAGAIVAVGLALTANFFAGDIAARAAGPPTLAGCPMFPANNIWNARIDALPVHARSSQYINSIGANTVLHADFGTTYLNAPIGIPYTVVLGTQPLVTITFDLYPWSAGESDPGPYPIPPGAPIEGGNDPGNDGDRHVLVLDRAHCKLYEVWKAYPQPDGSWRGGSGAVFDLNSNALRPDGWTSADAAGLPILPGLVRRDEMLSGEINHAIRFTALRTQRAYIWPARHFASTITDPGVPPMGQRFRLKASVPISQYHPHVQVIFTAFKRFGLILADNGSNWYVSGAHDMLWDDEMLSAAFRSLRGSDFEAVDVSSLMVDPNSGQARPPFTHWTRMPIVRR